MNKCTNCLNTFSGNFCNECGQKLSQGRISFRELMNDFMANFFSLDSPPFRTIKKLTLKPGEMIREFISGKRKKYYKPVQYFILMLAFYLLVRTILGFNPVENQYKILGKNLPPMEVIQKSPQMKASMFMSNNINMLLFVFVFIFGLFGRMVFRKSNYNYIENITFSFYTTAQYMFLSTFVIPLTFIAPHFYYLSYFIILGYLTYALVSFHKSKMFTGSLKGLVTVVVSFVLYVSIVYAASIYYMILTMK